MNIFKHEYKANLKVFLFWVLGLFLLVFLGMTKFTGIQVTNGSESLNDFMQQFPKVILAVFGMVEVDVTTLEGYYSIIGYYVIICGVIYAIHLGTNAVSREVVDKTYEFVFTKPCSRNYVLTMKLTAAWLNLLLFSILSTLFSIIAIQALKFNGEINVLIILYSINVLLISSIFFALSAFLSVTVKNSEKATLYSNLIFITAFIMGIVYDTVEEGAIIKFISPLKYFEAKDLIMHRMDLFFVIICMVLILLLLLCSFIRFKKKDFIMS